MLKAFQEQHLSSHEFKLHTINLDRTPVAPFVPYILKLGPRGSRFPAREPEEMPPAMTCVSHVHITAELDRDLKCLTSICGEYMLVISRLGWRIEKSKSHR